MKYKVIKMKSRKGKNIFHVVACVVRNSDSAIDFENAFSRALTGKCVTTKQLRLVAVSCMFPSVQSENCFNFSIRLTRVRVGGLFLHSASVSGLGLQCIYFAFI